MIFIRITSNWYKPFPRRSCQTCTVLLTDYNQGYRFFLQSCYVAKEYSLAQQYVQASLVIRDLTLRVFAVKRYRGGGKPVRKLYSNFAVTVYGGGVTVWLAHQPVTS
jgi:hypothetical protein